MDIEALQNELTNLSDRWQELDEQMTAKLVEFQNWMHANFPKPATAGFWDPHIPFQLYPAATGHCSSAFLDMDILCNATDFIFTAKDQDGDSYTIRLPFAWIQDPEAFRATVQEQVDTEQARLEAAKPARQEKLNALSAARAQVQRLERELQSNA
jgi:hypothetical protein